MGQRTWRRPRQADIAREVGVSQATVSYVLNGGRGSIPVTEETRQRVLATARRLGYVANVAARNLASGTNRLIGIYTFETAFTAEHHDFYHPFLAGVEDEAVRSSYDLLLLTSATAPDGKRSVYLDGVNRLGLSDGSILMGKDPNPLEIVQLRDDGLPFVVIGRHDLPSQGISYVAADYATATAQIVDHLATQGHRCIGYVSASAGTASVHRDAGFWPAAQRHGLEVADLVYPDVGLSSEHLRHLLGRGVTALVVDEPLVALDIIDLLGRDGVSVPAGCSVAALDDLPDPAAAGGLTCVRTPRRAMGRRAVQVLLDRLENRGRPGKQVLLGCTVVAGRTTSSAPR